MMSLPVLANAATDNVAEAMFRGRINRLLSEVKAYLELDVAPAAILRFGRSELTALRVGRRVPVLAVNAAK
jgi:hypothetical protein